jgi:hypothetical protein
MTRLLLKMFLLFSLVLLGSIFFVHADEGDVLFADNFEDSKDLPDWHWSADDHHFARVVTDGENRALRMVGSSDGASLYADVGEEWENYALELRFQIVTPTDGVNYDFVLIVRNDLENNAGAGAIFNSPTNETTIAAYRDGNYHAFDPATFEFNVGEWYDARFAVQGDQLELSINGVVVSQVETDVQGSSGGIGLEVGDSTVILFDDLRVTELAAPEQVTVSFGDTVRSLTGDTETPEADSNTTDGTVTAQVVVNTANLRSGPGTDNPIVATARRGDTFEVVAQAGEGDDIWYRVVGADPNLETWVFSSTVEIEPADADIPEVDSQ